MITYLKCETLIESQEDLVELNLIRLVRDILKSKKMDLVYNDTERCFYVYNGLYWIAEDVSKVLNIFWQIYEREIFDLIKQKKIKVATLMKKEKDKEEPDQQILAIYKNTLERVKFFEKLKVKDAEKLIESLSFAIEHLKDDNYNKIPLLNGYIDIEKDFSFHKLDPYIYNRYCLDFRYNEKATVQEPKIFMKFLTAILPDEESREFLLNWIANLFVNGNHRQKALFFYGAGRNGKGVLVRIIIKLLGDNNCSSLNVKQLNGEKYHLSQLLNKLVNISPDSDKEDRMDTGTFKSLTGGDKITVRDPYRKPFPMIFTGKMIFSVNRVPYFNEKDFAVRERVEILNFPVKVGEKDRIPNLENIILEKEGDIIFNFLLHRAKELSKINFKFKAPDSVLNFTSLMLDEQDNLSVFINEYVNKEENENSNLWSVPLTNFYNIYKEFAQSARYKELNRTNFKQEVLNWAERNQAVIDIKYIDNGKNFIFKFMRKTYVESKLKDVVYLKNDILVDKDGNEIF